MKIKLFTCKLIRIFNYMRKLYPGDIYVTINESMQKDKFVQAVKEKFEERSQTGIKKYNTTLEREDLNLFDWLTHLQEELMDATLYVEKLKSYAKEDLPSNGKEA
tara:strand:+ start:302 stop:616 length:315 start_codon:yes stop_codon:yes gene_type:complete